MADRIPFDSRLNIPVRRWGWGRLVLVLACAALAGLLFGGCATSPTLSKTCAERCGQAGARYAIVGDRSECSCVYEARP